MKLHGVFLPNKQAGWVPRKLCVLIDANHHTDDLSQLNFDQGTFSAHQSLAVDTCKFNLWH
jgi:hypothetical protein